MAILSVLLAGVAPNRPTDDLAWSRCLGWTSMQGRLSFSCLASTYNLPLPLELAYLDALIAHWDPPSQW